MNYWTQLSIDYANQRSYLDDLFRVYPTIPEGIRDIDSEVWGRVEESFHERNNIALIENLLKLALFPIKDSYVAYLRRDPTAIRRNPATVARLCGRLYEMGLDQIFARASEPKETNRQIGPLFRRWINQGSLGIPAFTTGDFLSSDDDAILDGSDAELKAFANEHLGYDGNKGLDLLVRLRGRYIIGEAKFLTDFGGHQNAQFNDAVSIFDQPGLSAVPIAILDGVLYIKSRGKMYNDITSREDDIMSSLVLREFLYQV